MSQSVVDDARGGGAFFPSRATEPAMATSAAASPHPGAPPRAVEPPSPRVQARRPLDAGALAARTELASDSAELHAAERLLGRGRRASRDHAALLRDIAALWVDRDEEDLCDDREESDVAVSIALRTTTTHAATLLRDAHLALTDVPATFARLEAGDMPVEWFDRLLRVLRDRTAFQRSQIDARVSTWDLASIPVDRFRRALNLLLAWFATPEPEVAPQEKRDVALEMHPVTDGTACLRITGPIPEILALSRRLDSAARAVQDAQRHALADSAPVPFDPEDVAASTGRRLPLRALRYAVMTRSLLDTGTVEVPKEPFRMNVVVPVLSLLGESDAPAVLDGTIPIPAAMARMIAAEESVWFRVLTDPVDGSFLPVPATQYRPPLAMREHLRLRDPVCAVPGCGRSTSSCSESDHIEEYDHDDPTRGGQTCLDNLHDLCRLHHRLKTLGLIDPVRGPDGTTTHWTTRSGARASVPQNTDLTTPELAAVLSQRWEEYVWKQDLEAMVAAGELERAAREDGPADPLLDEPGLDPTGADGSSAALLPDHPPF